MTIDLSAIYKQLLTGEISIEEASDLMKSSQIRSLINSYIYKDKINNLVPYFEEDLQNIFMLINITQYIYNNGGEDTGLTDSEYDTLYAIMIANGGSDVISVPIVPTSTNIVYHKYPSLRGTLTKTFYLTNEEERTNPSRRYLDEWKASMENKIFSSTGRNIDLDNEEIYVFPKFDGVSGIFEITGDKVDRVLTRGYTETNEAQDITHVFNRLGKRKYHELKSESYGLKTEIMMQESDLEYYNNKYKTNYKNTRSIVSAILNSDDYDEEKSSLLHVVPLRVGDDSGYQEIATEAFDNYPYLRCRLKDREAIRKFANEHRYVNGELRTDGAVIYIINPEIQKILGRENNKNNFEVAYKFTEEVAFSELIDINFNMGLFGRLAPVAKVKPVKLKGNTIENISLGSIGRMRELKLRKGDRVKVLYDIIPYLVFDDECSHTINPIISIPNTCPDCGEELSCEDDDSIVSCTNPECPCRQKGKILNYLNKMNIDGISYGIIDKLYDNNIVRSIKDLYKMEDRVREMSSIERFGGKLITSMLDAIKLGSQNVYDYTLMGALGIEGISKKKFQKLLSQYTIDELLDISESKQYSKIALVSGFSDKTAQKVIEGIQDNIKLIEYLQKKIDIIETYGDGADADFTVCFTKIRDKNLEDWIESNGGSVVDSLTKDTTYLVVPDDAENSSKMEKARKYGIPIVKISNIKSTIQNR